MPTVEVPKVIVRHVWDDGSSTDFEIERITDSDGLPAVKLAQGDDSIYLYPESWSEIHDQLWLMFEPILEQQKAKK